MAFKNEIIDRLQNLKSEKGIEVKLKNHGKTVKISYHKEQSLGFTFVWKNDNHFAGYFVDDEGKPSQAVISL